MDIQVSDSYYLGSISYRTSITLNVVDIFN